jgi:MFS family permease
VGKADSVEAGAFLTVYAVRLGSPETDATLLVAALGLGNMLLVPLLGWLADKIDRRWVLILCGSVGIVGSALLPATNAAGPAALALIFVWGGFIAGLYAVGLAHLGSTFRGGELAAANAAFAILYAGGVLVGPSLGGIGMDLWNPHGLPVVLGLISAALVAVIAFRAATIPRPGNGPSPG